MTADGQLATCAFCAIAAGRGRVTEVVAETDRWLAMFPLHPAVRGHTMVLPKIHVEDFWQATPDLLEELGGASHSVGQAIKVALNPDGMNLITSAGVAAEQSVFHLHLHLLPRWKGDAFPPIWPRDQPERKSADLRSLAAAIRDVTGDS